MKRTSFVCFGASEVKDALVYQELPRKENGEEFFLFFSPGDSSQEHLLRKLFRVAISASRLGHPTHYFTGFLKSYEELMSREEAGEELLTGVLMLIMIRREREVYLFHNRDAEIAHWDVDKGVEDELGWVRSVKDVPLRGELDQGDLFKRSTGDVFALRRFILMDGSHTLAFVPSREFLERYSEDFRDSIFFPSFRLPRDLGFRVGASHSFPALRWNIERKDYTVLSAPSRLAGLKRISVPAIVGAATGLLAILIMFGPLGKKDRSPKRDEALILLSAEETGGEASEKPAGPDESSVDLTEGRKLSLADAWKVSFSAPVTSSPRYCGESVFFGCRDGFFYSLSPEGKINWKYDSGAGIGASPCCVSDKVIGANYNGEIFCLDAANGRRIWSYAAGAKIISSPRVGSGMVLAGTMDGRLLALRLKNGAKLWEKKIGESVWATGVIGGDYVVAATTDGALLRLDHGGNVIWRVKRETGILSSMLCLDHDNLVVFGSKDKYIFAYSLDRGDLMWRYLTEGEVNGAPLAAGDLIIVGSRDNNLYALRRDGRLVWRKNLGGSILSRPLAVGQTVFVTTYGSKLVAVELESGEIKGEYKASSPIYSSPEHGGERIFFGSNGGVFHAVRLYDGLS